MYVLVVVFHRKQGDELATPPVNPTSIHRLDWSADEDKTYLVNSLTDVYDTGTYVLCNIVCLHITLLIIVHVTNNSTHITNNKTFIRMYYC